MKIYREVWLKGEKIHGMGSQMYATEQGVLEAIEKRAEKCKKLFGYRIEKFNRHPWDSCSLKEANYTTILTVERKVEMFDDNKHDSTILGFVTYEVK